MESIDPVFVILVTPAQENLKDITDGFSKITRDEATQMANKTYPLAQEEGYYMSGLDVFHQLHCLVRSFDALHP